MSGVNGREQPPVGGAKCRFLGMRWVRIEPASGCARVASSPISTRRADESEVAMSPTRVIALIRPPGVRACDAAIEEPDRSTLLYSRAPVTFREFRASVRARSRSR